MKIGEKLYNRAKDLFPINRSITGSGVRETLHYLKRIIPNLEICSVKSGYKAFDWVVPEEWEIKEAWIKDEDGAKVVDFSENNLHVVGYSVAVDKWLNREELEDNLFSIPEMPDAIPYVTSYYKKTWGFCITENLRRNLTKKKYHVRIDSRHMPGELNYAEILIPGKSKKEVFLSTYICHPSMANNELSGPIVTSAIAEYLLSKNDLHYTYRIIFVPETIGSIVYLSKYIKELQANVLSGFNITCIGDDNCYSFLPSRDGDTLSDKVAKHVLSNLDTNFKIYSWNDRGSDERQYCSPGVDLPIASVMRSKYGEYKEYHTSLDNLDFISPNGLEKGYEAMKLCIDTLEINAFPKLNILCEPHLTKYNLYPTISRKGVDIDTKNLVDFLSYCDGTKDIVDIANLIDQPSWKLKNIIKSLEEKNIISIEKLIYE